VSCELKAKIIDIEDKLKSEEQKQAPRAYMVGKNSGHRNIADLKRGTMCIKYGKKGHWAKECRSKANNDPKQAGRQRNSSSRPTQGDSQPGENQEQKQPPHGHRTSQSGQDVVFTVTHNIQENPSTSDMASKGPKLSEEILDGPIFKAGDFSHRDKWFSDSAATIHICNKKSKFSDLEYYKHPSSIAVGDNSLTDVLGKGKVEGSARVEGGGHHVTIEDVLFVPGMSANLISIGQLNDKGIDAVFDGG